MEVVKEYISYLKDKKKLSENTVSSYFIDIKKYTEYLFIKNINIGDVVENDIISYLIKLEKDNISVATISRMISSIKKPKIEKNNLDILTEEEVEALLKFPKLNTPKQIRDKAIFEILYGTGIKVSELVEMNLDNVDLELDYIYCSSNKNQRIIPLSDITRLYLEKYIKESRPELAVEDEKALFVSSLGQRFTRQGLWKLIKKHASLANIDKNINPSMLRHSFAIHLLNEGANVAVVSKILGNANLASLQSYLNHINKNMRREIKEKHPRK